MRTKPAGTSTAANHPVRIYGNGDIKTSGSIQSTCFVSDPLAGQGYCINSTGTAELQNLTVNCGLYAKEFKIDKIIYSSNCFIISICVSFVKRKIHQH